MKELEVRVRLFDGFIFDNGLYPLFFIRGYVPPGTNRAYVTTPRVIKHELYGILLRELGIEENDPRTFCNENCFATHRPQRYDPHAGLCQKHFNLLDDLRGRTELRLTNKLHCHPLRERKLRREVLTFEQEFQQQTGIDIENISFEREYGDIRDGDWLYIFEDEDKILRKFDEEQAKDSKGVLRLLSIRPYRSVKEFEESKRREKEVGEPEEFDVITAMKAFLLPLEIIDKLGKVNLTSLLRRLRQGTDLDSLVCLLEYYQHKGHLTFDERNGSYSITERGKEHIEFWKSLIEQNRTNSFVE